MPESMGGRSVQSYDASADQGSQVERAAIDADHERRSPVQRGQGANRKSLGQAEAGSLAGLDDRAHQGGLSRPSRHQSSQKLF
jgi:hypothetical protein